jgi:hypothetical protein
LTAFEIKTKKFTLKLKISQYSGYGSVLRIRKKKIAIIMKRNKNQQIFVLKIKHM